jgi:3-oxoacyl-[acyl-carrier protein] reductase
MKDEQQWLLPGLAGKTAVVTGGASGIGKQICLTLGRMGMNIGIIDINVDKGRETLNEFENASLSTTFCQGDVTNEELMERCFARIYSLFGGLDTLVNNAGTSRNIPIQKLELTDWNAVLNVNLKGAFICSKTAIPYMMKQKKGSIIMISSGSALTGSGGSACYAASKGGLNSLVRALSRELAPKGIRVNGVAPRSIEGDLLNKVYTAEQLKKMQERIPLGRMGTYQDVANVVSFLASELSAFLTGETILLDGGRTFGA